MQITFDDFDNFIVDHEICIFRGLAGCQWNGGKSELIEFATW